jgi:hypothetical protein
MAQDFSSLDFHLLVPSNKPGNDFEFLIFMELFLFVKDSLVTNKSTSGSQLESLRLGNVSKHTR